MARAVLNELITLTTSGAIVSMGTAVTVLELDGVTPIAQTMYNAASGGSVVSPGAVTTSSTGRILVYVTTPQRCMLKVGSNTPVLAEFRADPADVPTLTAAQTFTNSKLMFLPDPLDDNWAHGSGAGAEYIGLSRGTTASPPQVLGTPLLWLQEKVKQNQDPARQIPFTSYIQKDMFGSALQTLRTLTSAGASSFADSGASWTPSAFAPSTVGGVDGAQISIVSGTGAGQERMIASNTDTSGTIMTPWDVVPDGTSTYVINAGGALQGGGLLVCVSQYSSSRPANLQGQEAIGIMSYARQLDGNGGAYAELLLTQSTNDDGQIFGLEVDVVRSGGGVAPTWATTTGRSIGVNVAGFVAGGSTKNSLGYLLQSSADASFHVGMEFGYNSVSNYAADPGLSATDAELTKGIVIDFERLSRGTTTPKLIRAGSGHTILLGRAAALTSDIELMTWVSDVLAIKNGNASLSLSGGNVVIAGTTPRIQGDLSNATLASRLMWQTSTTNGNTNISAIPNGSGTAASMTLFTNSAPASGPSVRLLSGTAGHILQSQAQGGALQPLYVSMEGNPSLQFATNGDIVPGSAALATTATAGFMFVETCAGAPTGVPTSYTGRAALVFDTTNNKLMVYDGGWIGVTLS